MKVIFGLGNPGKQYESTRHNAGFLLLDIWARLEKAEWQPQTKFKAQVARLNQDLLLVKPQTFMNSSGETVAKVKSFYKLSLKDFWVVHDDLDFNLGEYKLSLGKGPKSHNGLKSIAEKIGGDSFWRARIGVESRQEKTIPGKEYVLQKLTLEEKTLLTATLKQAIKDIKDKL